MARTLVYLFLGTRGGRTRFAIARTLSVEPLNTNQLAHRLLLDYKTVQHHLRLLESYDIVVSAPPGAYGALHYLAPSVLEERDTLDEVSRQLGMNWFER